MVEFISENVGLIITFIITVIFVFLAVITIKGAEDKNIILKQKEADVREQALTAEIKKKADAEKDADQQIHQLIIIILMRNK